MKDTLHCRYEDCPEGHPVAENDEQVTCPTCRAELGLPSMDRARDIADDLAESEASTEAKNVAIVCPKCGEDEINVIEDCVIERGPIYITDDGRVECDGYYTAEGWDEVADNQRFHCRNCGEEFPIPEGIEVEWV